MIMMGDRKKAVTAILGPEEGEDQGHEENSLHHIAEEIISCIHAKDAPGLADALKAAVAECESEPHHEGPHTDEE